MNSVLEVRGLRTSFHTERGVVRAVDNLSFSLQKGEILGVVGESGCGKSVTALSIMRLVPQPAGLIEAGSVFFCDQDLIGLSENEMRRIRGSKIAMIFQDPMTSLNPVFTIGDQIAEAVRAHQRKKRQEAYRVAAAALLEAGISDAERRIHEYPHQLSGGMRQRAVIAMALACRPKVLIADEPTTALDVTIQAQILDLICNLQSTHGVSVLMITHDLGIIGEVANRVIVMYGGQIMEENTAKGIFNRPLHPYTRGLMASAPSFDNGAAGKHLPAIPGTVPDLLKLPLGCRFQERCTDAFEPCTVSTPELIEVTDGHRVRCFKYPSAIAR